MGAGSLRRYLIINSGRIINLGWWHPLISRVVEGGGLRPSGPYPPVKEVIIDYLGGVAVVVDSGRANSMSYLYTGATKLN